MMKRNLCILLFLAFMGWLVVPFFSGNYSEVTVVNTGDAVITKASVTLSETTHSIGPLKPNEKSMLRFPIKGDASYSVVAEFENARRIQQDVGYVTNGMDFREVISISPQKVTITTNEQ